MIKKVAAINDLIDEPFSIPTFLDTKNIASLTGWRAVGVIIVILGHFKLTLEKGNFFHEILRVTVFAELGVKIFFLLSGFLITSLLLKEKIITKKINVVNFFIRRFLRICPALYLYLVIVALINYYLELKMTSDHFLGPILYLYNFGLFQNNWLTGHTWSLAVEEQFYFIWPFLLKSTNKLPAVCLTILLIIIPILKIICNDYPNLSDILLFPFFVPASSIFAGCLLSLLTFKNKINLIITDNKNFKAIYFILTLICIYFIHYCTTRGILNILTLPFSNVLTDVCIAYLMLFSMLKKSSLIFRILNSNLFVQVGMVSYSLYIWQQLFILPENVYPNSQLHIYFPINLILIFVIGFLSYNYFEKPILNLKQKFATL